MISFFRLALMFLGTHYVHRGQFRHFLRRLIVDLGSLRGFILIEGKLQQTLSIVVLIVQLAIALK